MYMYFYFDLFLQQMPQLHPTPYGQESQYNARGGVKRTKNEYIQLLHASDKLLTKQFGVCSLRLFGSVARNEHTSASDVDICVETETPNPFLIMDLKEYPENLFGCSVDIVRLTLFRHSSINFLI